MPVSDLSAVHERMSCCCKGLPQKALRNIFRRIRCISLCCNGKIVIQASDIDGEEIFNELYYSPVSPASRYIPSSH